MFNLSKAQMLDIYAGKSAAQTLRDKGLDATLFTALLGASGGPKWFSLYGLDRYLFGSFFSNHPGLDILGSSAGAFRAACFAQSDPVSAIERLGKYYSETVYTKNAKPAEITRKAKELIEHVFQESGAITLTNNERFRPHFVVAQAKGLARKEQRWIQGAGLASAYFKNKSSRSKLARHFDRVIFASQFSQLSIEDPDEIPTRTVTLNEGNALDSVLASGSIPMLMEGIPDVQGAGIGMYRDGGIVDYHFDVKIHTPGLVLYPHFSHSPKPGWFDKSSKRTIRPENYDNIVMLCPSLEFIESLPYSKIPDRNDFTQLAPEDRLKYWRTVFERTQELAEHLDQMIHSFDPNTISVMQ